jgi:hypothetical protein
MHSATLHSFVIEMRAGKRRSRKSQEIPKAFCKPRRAGFGMVRRINSGREGRIGAIDTNRWRPPCRMQH